MVSIFTSGNNVLRVIHWPTELVRWTLITAVILLPFFSALALFCLLCAATGFTCICFTGFYESRRKLLGEPKFLDINGQILRLTYYLLLLTTFSFGYLATHFLWLDIYDLVCGLHPLCKQSHLSGLKIEDFIFIGSCGTCAAFFGGAFLYKEMQKDLMNRKS